MAEGSFSLQDKKRTSTGRSKKRLKKSLENETTFLTEENEDVDSPEELLLPGEHPSQRVMMKYLPANNPPSLSEDEDEEERPVRQRTVKDSGIFTKVKVSSGCMCKLLVVLYLLGCLLISTLYVAIYGPNELYIVPESSHKAISKPVPSPLPSPQQFYDNPYTEWIAQRMTYDNDAFAEWPTLPEYILSVRQVASGEIDSRKGVWLLDVQGLYFMYDVDTFDSVEDISLVNVSDSLNLYIQDSTRICVNSSSSLYVISPGNVTLLDCSPFAGDYCDISFSWSIPSELMSITSSVISGSDGNLWLGTDYGLYRLNTTTTTPPISPTTARGTKLLATTHNEEGVVNNPNVTEVTVPLVPVTEIKGPVISLAWRGGLVGSKGWGLKSRAFILTNYSHFSHRNVSFSSSKNLYQGELDAVDDFGLLVIGTPSRIYFYDGNMIWFEWVSVWDIGLGGVVDGPPTSLTFVPTGELFIGNNVSLSRLNIDYTFDRIGGQEGLPYNHIRSLHYSPVTPRSPSPLRPTTPNLFPKGTLWIGTDKGWSILDIEKSTFIGYFNGPRWHPGSVVLDICGVGSSKGEDMTIVLTDEGLSVVYTEQWTLKKKAAHYQTMLNRHIREPGLVADCDLSDFIPASCTPAPTDNDGLWTSWLVAAEALRYNMTNDPEARTNAWRFYRAMKFLVEVTGIPGLPARSVLKINVSSNAADDFAESGLGEELATTVTTPTPNDSAGIGYGDENTWHNSSVKSGWIWKGNASSDEIVGHIFANTIAYDLLAQTPEEKQEVASTLDSIIGYIKDNNYTLVGLNNRLTRWGMWNPSFINHDQLWADEHGLNSLQILSGLLSAYRVTGKYEYFEAWKELFNGSHNGLHAHYGLNMINQKITFPRDINYSDDELAFLPYFVYFQSLKKLPNIDKRFNAEDVFFIPTLSLNKAWKSVRKEKSAAWHAIYASITGDDSLTEDITWSLRNWPLELIQWKTDNSHRLDIEFQRGKDRFFHDNSQSVSVLSPRERTQLRWNGNPYLLDYPGSSNEMDPGPWLMSYWLTKWTRLL